MLSHNNKLRKRLEYKEYTQNRFSVFVKIISRLQIYSITNTNYY